MISVPAFSEPVEVHSDWMEFAALAESDDYVSWSDYKRDLGLSVSAEEADRDLGGSSYEPFETLINDIVLELNDRARACSKNRACYPFTVSDDGLEYHPGAGLSYVFQLILTLFGKDAGPQGTYGERIFEDLSAVALGNYIATENDEGEHVVFGFPRRILPSAFPAAVDELCRSMGEGEKSRGEPGTKNKKDAALDVVAWRGFPDRKTSKLVVFGQCSTGKNWRDKLDSLRPRTWCKLWLYEQPHADPLGAFFVPRRIEPAEWRETGMRAGILFDRCRISWLTPGLSCGLTASMKEWTEWVLSQEEARDAA